LEHVFSFDEVKGVKNWLDVIENGVVRPKHETMKNIQEEIIDEDLFH
jgi:hypothetical protein